jgi:hypothetical protein
MNSKLKLKKSDQPKPKYEISLKFSNNLFQANLLDIFGKFNVDLHAVDIKNDDKTLSNLIRITYQEEIFLLCFFGKKLNDNINSEDILLQSDDLLKLASPNNITLIFFEINEENLKEKTELIYFINTHLNIKIFDCNLNTELADFLQNYVDAIVTKEEKSKLTFYESKPVASTNLCALEGITEEKSIIWVKHLMCIPGVSERKAISVVKAFPTLQSLMEIYDSTEFNEKEKESYLKDVEIVNKTNNTTKKLGKVLSAKIYKVFNELDPDYVISEKSK